MKRDSRLSIVLHGLLHMKERDGPMTSAELAQCMDTNPVVVRRTFAGLRKAGLVRSGKGHGGGWELGRDLDQVSLWQVYEAIGEPDFFALGNHAETPGCLIEQAINARLDRTFEEARKLLVARLSAVSLGEIWAGVGARFSAHHAAQRAGQHTHQPRKGSDDA